MTHDLTDKGMWEIYEAECATWKTWPSDPCTRAYAPLAATFARIRDAAYEEAAKVADKTPDEILVFYSRGPNSPPGNNLTQVRGQRLIASAIRSLSKPLEKENG